MVASFATKLIVEGLQGEGEDILKRQTASKRKRAAFPARKPKPEKKLPNQANSPDARSRTADLRRWACKHTGD
jgi:hypothetical protein